MIEMEKKVHRTSYGDIAYLEVGSPDRPPVLFVHGIPTSSYLWRHVLRFLQNDFHCYAPDLMGLGDTDVDPDRTAFHMEAQAEMLEELMIGLGHESFSLVCHDQGGAAGQLLAAYRPALITCLVLTDCVCYDSYVRKRSPATKILLGSYAAQAFQASYDAETQKRYVDHVVQGEGVRFLRELLGQGVDRPIRTIGAWICGWDWHDHTENFEAASRLALALGEQRRD